LRCGVPAVSVDGAWSPEAHALMHTPDDDPERIDVDGFHRAVQVIVAAAWRLANEEE
jgi:Iap family predicted aminopeptidase